MATAIRMPDLGATVEEVRILRWLKQEGQAVRRGEPLCEVETDKANGQLESEADGVLLCQTVPEGGMVVRGGLIAYIGQAGETLPPEVEAARPARVPRPGRREPWSSVNQQAVARRVAQSHREIVPYNVTCRIEMTAAEGLRQHTQTELRQRVTLDSVFVYAVARIITHFPHFRSHVVGDQVVTAEGIHVGFAVGFRDALYLLVVREADRKSVGQIEQDVTRLTHTAAARQATLEDLTGACFAISNLGMYPIDSFNVVIPPLQSAALAVGAVQDHLAMRDGKVVSIPMVSATLTVDHRIINGREAGDFIAKLKHFMESLHPAAGGGEVERHPSG